MVLPLLIGTPVRVLVTGLFANEWITARELEKVRFERTRIYAGIALVAIGAYFAWKQMKEKKSIAVPGLVGLLGLHISLDGLNKIRRTYQRIMRNRL